MLKALLTYLWDEAFPRTRGVFVSFEFGAACVLAASFGYFGTGVGIATANTGDVVLALLAYAAIAFGFSVAGLTLVLTAPDRDFAAQLAWSDPSRPGIAAEAPARNSYGNLLFIFSWTAIAHWVVVVGSFVLLLALGRDTALMATGSSIRHRTAASVEVFAVVYAAELFLVTVLTLAQVGQAYITRLQTVKPGERPPCPPAP